MKTILVAFVYALHHCVLCRATCLSDPGLVGMEGLKGPYSV